MQMGAFAGNGVLRAAPQRAHCLPSLHDACLRHWYKDPGPNPFGNWNGQNLLGLDPAALLLKQNEARAAFSLRSYITALPALCTVRIHKSALPLAERYPALLAAPALATTPVAYEVDLNPQGVPLRIRALASGVVKPMAVQICGCAPCRARAGR